MVRGRIEISLVPISEYAVKTVTRDIPYKFAILNSPKINTLGENCHQFLLAYQNLTKPADLERGDPRLQQVGFFAQRGRNFRFTSDGRLDNRIGSKSRFSKVCFFNFAYLFTIKSIWGNSKSGKRGIKRVSYKLI